MPTYLSCKEILHKALSSAALGQPLSSAALGQPLRSAALGQTTLRAAASVCCLLLVSCEFQQQKKYFNLPAKAHLQSGYKGEVLVRGIPLKGIHGLTVGPGGKLLVGSVVGSSIYTIDPLNGSWRVHTPPPQGMADDLAIGPDGTLVWTAFLDGKVYAKDRRSEQVRVIAEGLPGANSIAFSRDGRLFMTRVFLADELYELDLSGAQPPQLLMQDMGGLNGFEFGADNLLYGPLWFKGKVVRIQVDTGEIEDVADGFGIPAAVNFDPDGTLWVVDTQRGDLVSIPQKPSDPAEPDSSDGRLIFGPPEVRKTLSPALDNLAVSKKGDIYITNMSDNAVIHYDPKHDELHTLLESPLAVVGDLATGNWSNREYLYVADVFGFRRVELATGRVETLGRVFGSHVDYPLHLDISASGEMAVLTSWSAGKVQLYDLTEGEISKSIDVQAPHDAVFVSDTAVAWVEYASGALRMSENELENPQLLTDQLTTPSSLAYRNGQFYVAESALGRISMFDRRSGQLEVIADGLSRPEGIALTADGKLIVADAGADRLLMIDPVPDGQVTELAHGLLLDSPDGAQGALPTLVPVGVAVGGNGDIYVGSNREATIYRLRKSR